METLILEMHVMFLYFFFSKLNLALQIPDSKQYLNTRKVSIPNEEVLITIENMGNVS